MDVQLEEICRCLIKLLPLGWSEADYIKIWNSLEGKAPSIEQGSMENTEENKPEYTPTIFSSVKRLQYGNADDIAEKEWLGYFKDYYIKQCENTELIKKLFKRLTKNFKSKKNEPYKHIYKQMFAQISRWYILWEYIIDRDVELREIENKMKKSKQKFDILIGYLKWEFIHKDFENNIAKEWGKVDKELDIYVNKRIGEQKMQENSDGRNIVETDFGLQFIQEECCKKIKDLIAKNLLPARKKLLKIGINDTAELSFIVFRDLECIIDYMDMGWTREQSTKRFSKRILEILQGERIDMVSNVSGKAVQEEGTT